jgi:hypothetical protein
VPNVTDQLPRDWDLDVEASSPLVRLALAWSRLYDNPSDAVPGEVLAANAMEQGGGILGWAAVRVREDSPQSATQVIGRAIADLLAGESDELASHTDVHISVREGIIEDVLEFKPRIDDPASFQPSIRPVTWTSYDPSNDEMELRIDWLSGRFALARVDVDEDDDRVTVVVHEQRPPMYDADGNEIGILLVGRRQHHVVRLKQPLGQRSVFDGYAGAERPMRRG